MSENRATHLTSMWLANDYGSYQRWTNRLEELQNEHNDKDTVQFRLACEMEVLTSNHPLAPGLYCDMLDDMLRQVDWLEVAKDFMEE